MLLKEMVSSSARYKKCSSITIYIIATAGKLRILYEGFPMAMIIEQAGGVASTGLFRGKIMSILDIVPTGIHDKCPVLIGSKRDVDHVLNFYM